MRSIATQETPRSRAAPQAARATRQTHSPSPLASPLPTRTALLQRQPKCPCGGSCPQCQSPVTLSTLSQTPSPLLQRDLAIEPVVSSPTERGLTEEDIQAAIDFNQREFTDPYSLAVIRDVIGVSRFPAISDRELALGVARWQASHGIAQDGRLGPVTVTYVIEELQAENNDADAALLMLEFPRGTFLDVDTAFCGCRTELNDEINSANFFIGEYQACGSDTSITTGTQVEACISQRARARGERIVILGATSSSGSISVRRTPGRCGPLMDRITTAHEQIHSVHTRELQQTHGRGSRAFRQAFNDASDWVTDEVNSRRTDIAIAQWAIGILDRICP